MTEVDCLVIGASGPIGRSFRETLDADGYSSIGVSRSSTPRVDISDTRQAEELFGQLRPRTVAYLATSSGAELETDPSRIAASISTAQHVATLAAAAGVRNFVFCSSSAVYGTTTGPKITEGHPLLGTSGYARLKQDSEAAVLDTLRESPTRAVVLRVFNVYGPGCANSLINRLADPEQMIWDTDRFVRDYIHVADVAIALRQAIEYQGSHARFNVGTGRGTSNRELLAMTGSWSTPVRAQFTGVDSYSVADTRLTRAELGFEASITLESQIAQEPGDWN